MGPFRGKSDSIKEFDDMRQALAAREPAKSEGSEVTKTPENQPLGANPSATIAPAAQPPERTAANPEDCGSIISAGSTWQGTLKLEGSVRIDGQFAGEVDAQETVYISEGAQVDAKVKAAFVIVAGDFQGEVRCTERLELLPTSHVQGELTTKALTIREGAFIDGQIHMTGGESASTPVSAARQPNQPNQSGKKSSPGTTSPDSVPAGGTETASRVDATF